MSSSYLFGINKKFGGKRLVEYYNSWQFTPIVLDVLEDKYGVKPHIIMSPDGWRKMNSIMNHSDITNERICWELGNQQIFFTKDKNLIADAILQFIETHQEYAPSDNETGVKIFAMQAPHLVKRFNEIASDIRNLDENKYPYFVFKNTSCDDGVEYWFDYDRKKRRYKTLKDWDKLDNEFVYIENNSIKGFISITKEHLKIIEKGEAEVD